MIEIKVEKCQFHFSYFVVKFGLFLGCSASKQTLDKTERHIKCKMSQSPKRKWIRPGTTRLELNDHVLRETFRNLNARDLCVVADVCSVFKQNAQAGFSMRYKGLHFIILIHNKKRLFYRFDANDIDLRLLAPALRHFRRSLSAINIWLDAYNHSLRILKLVTQYI